VAAAKADQAVKPVANDAPVEIVLPSARLNVSKRDAIDGLRNSMLSGDAVTLAQSVADAKAQGGQSWPIFARSEQLLASLQTIEYAIKENNIDRLRVAVHAAQMSGSTSPTIVKGQQHLAVLQKQGEDEKKKKRCRRNGKKTCRHRGEKKKIRTNEKRTRRKSKKRKRR